MSQDYDAEQAIVDLLSNNWNDSNTDSITPTFSKIFEQPKTLNMDDSRDFVLIFTPTNNKTWVGIGEPTRTQVIDTVNIDIRSLGDFDDTGGIVDDGHVRKVLAEVRRILFSNVTSAPSGWDLLDPAQDVIEQNDRYRGIFRYIVSVNLIAHYRDQTA